MRHAHCIATQSLHRRPAAVSAYVRQHLQHTQTNVIRIGRAYSAWRVAIRYAVGGITVFHPNVTALCSGLRYRKSVCRLITFVRPNRREQNRTEIRLFRLSQGVETFGNISSPFCTFAVLWHPCKILWRSYRGNLSVGGVKHKKGSKIERCHIRVSPLLVSLLCFGAESHNVADDEHNYGLDLRAQTVAQLP